MFTIIISEKGGAERRETFDRNEINVGRVQGNDLMLPKGNVSKHHARLLFRDGRFIVTDLKSTNGTYVNGRKISQATIVREGDKIYIGDFVLRLETGHGAVAIEGEDAHAKPGPRISAVHRDAPDAASSSNPPADAVTGAPPPPLPPPSATIGSISASPMTPTHRFVEGQAVSHFPLERDPDSESAPDLLGFPLPRVPGAPRLPDGESARPRSTTAMLGIPVVPSAPRGTTRSSPQQTARRRALVALADRIADAIDLEALDRSPVVDEALSHRLEGVANEQSKAMRDDGEAPDAVDLESLVQDALRELVGIGPIGPLLDDDQTEDIVVPRPDAVLAVRGGQTSLVDAAFSSEKALARVVARLAHQSGEPLLPGEAIIDRRLPRGARMIAIAPPAASGWTLAIHKQIRSEGSLEDLVRAGTLSRPMAALLEAAVSSRANVLVVGAGTGLVAPMLAALAFASPAGERIAVVSASDEIHVGHAYVTRVALADRGARGEDGLWAATRLRPDRLVVASLAGAVAAATIDAVSDGSAGVMAGLFAPSLRQGLGRLAAQVALTRPGASIESSRVAIAECFDLAIELARVPDGRTRVARLAEFAGTDAGGILVNDLFLPNPDGTGEAGFASTGVIPRLAQGLAARGIRLDPALFKRR